ncbi:hypothetical protein LV779_16855 [Streptomyces thinghirensis]|nr:hypothetical protein [Streptomyces thinghirensis]
MSTTPNPSPARPGPRWSSTTRWTSRPRTTPTGDGASGPEGDSAADLKRFLDEKPPHHL